MELLRVVDRFSGILSLADVRTKSDDFLVDRLSYKFTTAMLSAFAVLCGVKSLYTVPIICWIPAQLRRYERAITAYCYANNTYFVPDDRVPSSIEERYEGLIIYYQWLVSNEQLIERVSMDRSLNFFDLLAMDSWCASIVFLFTEISLVLGNFE